MAEARQEDPDEFIAAQYTTEFPFELLWLWETYLDLSAARSMGPSGPNPIGFPDLVAWGHLYEHQFSPWELDAIRRLDHNWLKGVVRDNDSKSRNPGRRKRGRKS